MGETPAEVVSTMNDLRYAQCDILTLGQYLAPSPEHHPIKEFIDIEKFQEYRHIGLGLGFKSVLAGPLVRSSYQAEEVYNEFILSNK
jgi:lipoic acid synthetase